MQGNLADTYRALGRLEDALQIERDVHSGRLRLHGEEHKYTLGAAYNYANTLLRRPGCFEEARSLLRKNIPVAQRVVGESHELTLRMRMNYAEALCADTAATLDDLREAVTTLEDTERTARRVLGGTHPTTTGIEAWLGYARAALSARETPSES